MKLTVDQFRRVAEHLSGEDYTIHERLFPALPHLIQLVEDQPSRESRNEMAVTLAVSMIYAVWGDYSIEKFDSNTQQAIARTCRLLVDNYLETDNLDSQRYLLAGMAACKSDALAKTILHDLASGNTGEHSSIRIE